MVRGDMLYRCKSCLRYLEQVGRRVIIFGDTESRRGLENKLDYNLSLGSSKVYGPASHFLAVAG